ncbi:MAG TPA: hypothetical protein IAB36_00075 [Candidatus Egerieicola pullicola]|uniref:Stage III sporulation protein AG n=1 Tax=Candidatus Egerieicola pullicola TaxID=2840775 RepID=A0A9D1AH43_9FIRM|nr:hypothetical protein [Candidatus Egerieicola pullicola]
MPKWLCALTSEGGRKKRVWLLLGVGALLCLLVAFWPFGEQKTAPQPTTSQSQDSFEEQYRLSLQTQVEELLGQMAGVGQVKVYLTLSSTQQTQYQSDSSRQTDRITGTEQSSYQENAEEQVVLVEDDQGNSKALISSVKLPKVQGVAVICDGGDSPAVQKNISDAVSALLDIGASQISIARRAG